MIYNLIVINELSYNLVDSICSNSSYTFTDGSTQNNISTDFTYSSIIPSSFGCDSIINTILYVKSTNLELSVSEQNIITLNQNNASYQWFDCTTQELIPNEILQTYEVKENGRFFAIITKNDCEYISECIKIDNIITPKCVVVLPSAFSPFNSFTKNDVFTYRTNCLGNFTYTVLS